MKYAWLILFMCTFEGFLSFLFTWSQPKNERKKKKKKTCWMLSTPKIQEVQKLPKSWKVEFTWNTTIYTFEGVVEASVSNNP